MDSDIYPAHMPTGGQVISFVRLWSLSPQKRPDLWLCIGVKL